MPDKQYYAEVASTVTPDEEEWYGPQDIEDGWVWNRMGGMQDTEAEAETTAETLAKTYKKVRIVSQTTEVIGYIGD